MNLTIGVKGAVEGPVKHGWSPSKGFYTTRTWRGPREALRALCNQLSTSNCEYDMEEGPVSTLIAKFSKNDMENASGTTATEVPVDIWEFSANTTEKDILDSDVTAVTQISTTDKETIRKAIQTPNPDASPALTGYALELYELMLSGLRSARVNIPTLKKTRIVSGTYGIKASLAKVGWILTTATLTADEQIPPEVLFSLPTTGNSTRTNMKYGWLKKFPVIQQTGFSKFQVVSEYEYGLWPTLIYGSLA